MKAKALPLLPTPKPVALLKTSRHLEGIMQSLGECAYEFENVNMLSQSEALDEAMNRVAEVLDTVQTLLGVPLTAGTWTFDTDRDYPAVEIVPPSSNTLTMREVAP